MPKSRRHVYLKVTPANTRSGRQWFLTLDAGNGETLNHSETYTRRADAVRSAKRVKKLAAAARIVIVDSQGLLVAEVRG